MRIPKLVVTTRRTRMVADGRVRGLVRAAFSMVTLKDLCLGGGDRRIAWVQRCVVSADLGLDPGSLVEGNFGPEFYGQLRLCRVGSVWKRKVGDDGGLITVWVNCFAEHVFVLW